MRVHFFSYRSALLISLLAFSSNNFYISNAIATDGATDTITQNDVLPTNNTANYSIIMERPIFSKRRELSGNGGGITSQPSESMPHLTNPELALLGTITTGTIRLAIIRKNGQKSNIIAKQGDYIESYQIKDILKDKVIIDNDNTSYILEINNIKNKTLY